jgi:hypothetical protein
MRGIFGLLAVVGLGFGLPGCDTSGGDDAQLARFVGTWRAVSGTHTVSCPGIVAETLPVDDDVVWTRGVTSDLVQSLAPRCTIEADVMGSTASGSGRPCLFPDGSGGTETLTVDSYTFVLASDGQTAQGNGSASIVLNGGGASFTCTNNLAASYQKISQ